MPLVRTDATLLRKPLLAYAQEHTERITADTVSCNLPLVPETGAICDQVGVFHKLQQGLLVANLVPQMAHYLCRRLNNALGGLYRHAGPPLPRAPLKCPSHRSHQQADLG